MSARELVVLGTASQAPTRTRNHNGYLVCWDTEGILFDPGEGTQRQLIFAGRPATRITRICLTHLHGDHCLGLPGVLQRVALDRAAAGRAYEALPVHFPASGRPWVERLVDASVGRRQAVRLDPVTAESAAAGAVVADAPPLRITARPLLHRIDALGWRLEEPEGRRFRPDLLDAAGVHGPAVGRLEREGVVEVGGRRVHLDEVTEARPAQSVAVIMDTAVCDAAVALAAGVDLLLCEATFLDAEVDLAVAYRHLTARQAATIAREAGARQLVLSHLSSRYPDGRGHLAEASEVFPDVIVAEDLDVIPVPHRRQSP